MLKPVAQSDKGNWSLHTMRPQNIPNHDVKEVHWLKENNGDPK